MKNLLSYNLIPNKMNHPQHLNPVSELVRYLRAELLPIYGEGETKGMVSLIFQNLKEWDQTAIIMNYDMPVSDYLIEKIKEILYRLKTGEPIQYILGKANFYGMYLDVDKSTLIPRPETEQLVDLIVKENSNTADLRVLDIGTGTGAIAIALARNLPFSQVSALDISPDAISVARQNASKLKCKINFITEDLFLFNIKPNSFDIIVSNPPYICESEKKDMEQNVLDFEPASALFVPDNDPLLFYRRIASIARSGLRERGSLYFEINPAYSEKMVRMLNEFGYKNIEVIKDFYNRSRFIVAKTPSKL